MSSDKRFVLSKVVRGSGRALDLGGGSGELRVPLERRGYRYVNVDVVATGNSAIRGAAECLPLASETFELVVTSDSLEHFVDPAAALVEVRRVLVSNGRLVIWVPFLHPFHGDDYYRYTPIGLQYLLHRGGFRIESIEAPLWVFSVVAQAAVELLRRVGLGWTERFVERAAAWLDRRTARLRGPGLAFAQAYLVVARPCE